VSLAEDTLGGILGSLAQPDPAAPVDPKDLAVQMDPEDAASVVTRLRRARGQLDGVIAMIESGRDCADIVTQLAAASKAVDRAGFAVVACGLEACAQAEARGEEPPLARERLEKLFLSLA
jgi:DNA-binding FrmR family transcriptional regulator